MKKAICSLALFALVGLICSNSYAESGPDLVITTGSSSVAPGGKVTLSPWTVKNQGNVARGDFYNGFYLLTDSIITTSDTYLPGSSNSGLAVGASFNWGGLTLTIAGQTFTVTQASCTYAFWPASASHACGAETGSVSVTAGAGCPWTATSHADWITITSGFSGSGNGIVNYCVSANPGPNSRTGIMNIAGLTFTVTQVAPTPECSFCTAYYTLSVSTNPPPGGAVTITPQKCTYCAGDMVTLTATPYSGYKFSSWTGVDSSNGPTATVTMNGNRTVNANFTINRLYVSHDGLCDGKSLCFTSIQNAIDSAQSFAIIEITQETYYEDVIFDDPKVVTLQGGWDATFTSSSSYTTINGSITITNGTMILEYIILE